MHEFGLATEIVAAAVGAAEEAGAERITSVHVSVPPGDHTTASALTEAFRLAAAGTAAAEAVLETTTGEPGAAGLAVTAIDVIL